MTPTYTLVSHALCPYVQRAAIVLAEKDIRFERRDVDLAHKPQWFLDCSPLGKTPVLLVHGRALFESAAICDYLDETSLPPMHPTDAVERAQHRAWIAVASETLQAIAGFYSAPDEESLLAKANDMRAKFLQLESALASANHGGAFFAGTRFSIVDAAFAPVFRYFDVFDPIADFGVFSNTPRVNAWRAALRERASVVKAVRADYPNLLRGFLANRRGALAARMLTLAEIV